MCDFTSSNKAISNKWDGMDYQVLRGVLISSNFDKPRKVISDEKRAYLERKGYTVRPNSEKGGFDIVFADDMILDWRDNEKSAWFLAETFLHNEESAKNRY